MDVTFCEEEAYFSVTPHQGEIDGKEEQFLDIGYVPSPNNDIHDTYEKELQVYQKRKRSEVVTDPPLPVHVPNQHAASHEDHSEVITQSPPSSIHIDNVVNNDISIRDYLDDSNESIDVSNSPHFPIRKNRGIPPESPVQYDRTKHVEVDRHFIKEKLDAGIVDFPFVKIEDQLGDILTKALSNRSFHSCLDKLGIRNIYAPT
ncbi:hypothetical protein L3X38_038147 [Prunus dulcis]|uniref:Uncharacterized protein n=1 Tax=Prunus dulcis TaxID=3755 RepID=A0AAD4V5Y1_PRUDU|nr:hypothetical protein L3X38_038147 [Prunus dulcis]